MFLRNVAICLQVHPAFQPRRPTSTSSPPWEFQISHLWKLVSHIKGRTQIKDVREQGAEEIIALEWDGVTGGWRKLHNEDLHYLKPRMGIACSTHGRDERCVQNFVLKTWREETTWKTWVWGRILSTLVFKEIGWGRMWTGFVTRGRGEKGPTVPIG
jgi:hypothetical protein